MTKTLAPETFSGLLDLYAEGIDAEGLPRARFVPYLRPEPDRPRSPHEGGSYAYGSDLGGCALPECSERAAWRIRNLDPDSPSSVRSWSPDLLVPLHRSRPHGGRWVLFCSAEHQARYLTIRARALADFAAWRTADALPSLVDVVAERDALRAELDAIRAERDALAAYVLATAARMGRPVLIVTADACHEYRPEAHEAEEPAAPVRELLEVSA